VVPSSWLSVLLFFLFIAPGLLFDLLSEQRRAGFSESAFREISRIVLSSLVFSGFAFAGLAIVQWVQPAWMPDPRRLLEPGGSYARDHYLLILRTLALQGLLALVLQPHLRWAEGRSDIRFVNRAVLFPATLASARRSRPTFSARPAVGLSLFAR